MKPHAVAANRPSLASAVSLLTASWRRKIAWLGVGCACFLLGLPPAIANADEADSTVSGRGAAFVVKPASPVPMVTATPNADIVLPPAWAFGVLHGYYTNQAGVLRNLQRLEAGNFPVDAIWVDSAFWDLTTKGPEGYLDFKGDLEAYPDLRQLTRELQRRHIRFGIWIWDRILDANPEAFAEFESRGLFKPGRISGNGWHNLGLRSSARVVDFSNPTAAALWRAKLRPFLDAGVDFFKTDADPSGDYVRTHFQMAQQFGRHTQGRGFVLSQCNRDTPGDITRYPAAWTGDAAASWHQPEYPDTNRWILGGLRQQIEMVANPTWRHYQYPFLANDTGGFHPSSLTGAAAEELYIRWTQFSAFNSMMQVFGAPTVREQNAPFAWSATAQDNFRCHTHLRLRLFPYIYTQAHLTRLTGRKMVQGEAEHRFQYRFGDAFLVAPVHEPGATNRAVWLPAGERWIDYWTGQAYAGGQEVNVPAPLAQLPLLVRAGAIIPMRDYAPSVLRGNNATLTLEVYPEGAPTESQFTLYEDDGTSNAYLTNGFATTRLTCARVDTGVRVRIHPIAGQYVGRLEQRRWNLQLHLRAMPQTLTLNGRSLRWQHDARSGILRATWEADTAQASDVLVTTSSVRD